MDQSLEQEEKFRELACIGDIDSMKTMMLTQKININGQNKMNGWTALHWAAKRNHIAVVSYLLMNGADLTIQSKDGNIPAELTTNEDIRKALGGTEEVNHKESSLPITPNYLANPPFPYTQSTGSYKVSNRAYPGTTMAYTGTSITQTSQDRTNNGLVQQLPISYVSDENEIVLKVRLANSDERDFIEVELDKSKLTYEALLSLMCRELGVERRLVQKIRKLPNTIVRKDKDVKRLHDFQEMELVLTNKAISATSRQYSNTSVTEGLKSEQILY